MIPCGEHRRDYSFRKGPTTRVYSTMTSTWDGVLLLQASMACQNFNWYHVEQLINCSQFRGFGTCQKLLEMYSLLQPWNGRLSKYSRSHFKQLMEKQLLWGEFASLHLLSWHMHKPQNWNCWKYLFGRIAWNISYQPMRTQNIYSQRSLLVSVRAYGDNQAATKIVWWKLKMKLPFSMSTPILQTWLWEERCFCNAVS